MRGKRTVHQRMISARKRAMLRAFSPQGIALSKGGTVEGFTSSFTALLGEESSNSRLGLTSFRAMCQSHLTPLAAEIKGAFSHETAPKKGGMKFRLVPRLLESDEYKQFLGEAYAEEVMTSATPFVKALGMLLFDLGMPSVSACKTITPLPGGWLDLLVRGAQALVPDWRVSIAARKTHMGGKVEVLLCLDRVDSRLPTLTMTSRNSNELIH